LKTSIISEYGSPIFLTDDVKTIDRLTLSIEKITETELIARAAQALSTAIFNLYPPPQEALIFCGPGNNGNDGRALAPLLREAGYRTEIFDLRCDETKSLPMVSETTLIIDALFGSGLNRPLEGVAATWVQWMNNAPGIRMAIDIPSGWHGEANVFADDFVAVRAHHTLTLEFPKLSFFFPESADYVGTWQVVPFGLSPQAVSAVETPYRMVSPQKLCPLFKPLPKFLHKGTAGKVRLLAGSRGMMGAAALSIKAAYRTGAGWVEAWVPETEMQLLQMMVPEAITRNVDVTAVEVSHSVQADDSVVFGAGPGLGISDMAIKHLVSCVSQWADMKSAPTMCVLDADAVHSLATHPDVGVHVPPNSIITPHPGEFRRLAGSWNNDFQRLQLQRQFAAQHQVIVVLKGAHTSIAFPDGTVYFNTTGNPGMATAGSGDVLTGILLSLLAQRLPPQEAVILGVYLHGLAGDLAAEALGERSVMASDIVAYISNALLLHTRQV
jgi:NAD(P)H-hydrate epimerase